MLSILQNIGLPETLVIIVVAILVFGRRLPEVAARAAVQVQRARRAMSDLRRETGIDAELREGRERLGAAAGSDLDREADRLGELLELRESLDANVNADLVLARLLGTFR